MGAILSYLFTCPHDLIDTAHAALSETLGLSPIFDPSRARGVPGELICYAYGVLYTDAQVQWFAEILRELGGDVTQPVNVFHALDALGPIYEPDEDGDVDA